MALRTENIYKIFKDFNRLTNIHISLLDTDYNEKVSYPEGRFNFCAKVRTIPEIDRKCRECDKNACIKSTKSNKTMLYKCHLGLTEAVVPIKEGDSLSGYVMFGQILPKEEQKEIKSNITSTLSKMNIKGMAKAVASIPVKSKEEINAAATVLEALTAYLFLNRFVTPERSDFISLLDSFIDENIHMQITCKDICREFKMSKTRLYGVSTQYLGCGIAEYIRKKRISLAQKMLSETDISITEIAFNCGFSDYNQFARVFKKHCKISAGEYRKLYSKN